MKKLTPIKNYPTNSDQKLQWDVISKDVNAKVAYNETLLVLIKGYLDIARLQQAISFVSEKHESMRSAISNDGHYINIYERLALNIDLVIEDAKNISNIAKHEIVNSWLAKISNNVFELSEAPLYKYSLLQLDEKNSIFSVTAVNLITDGISFISIVKDIADYYNNKIDKKKFMQHSEFFALQKKYIENNISMTEFWEKILLNKQIDRVDIATNKVRPRKMTFEGNHEQFNIHQTLSNQIKSFCFANNITVFSCLFSTFCLSIYRLSSKSKFIVGVPFGNRYTIESLTCVGFCMSVFPLFVEINLDDDLVTFIRRNMKAALEAYENIYVDINEILNRTSIKLTEQRPFHFDVLFNLERPIQKINFENTSVQITGLNSPYEKLELDDILDAKKINMTSRHAQFDLTLNLIDLNENFSAAVEYSHDIFAKDDIIHLRNVYIDFLQQINTENIHKKIGEIFFANH